MKNKGFTLIELLVVIAILGIIAAIVIPNIGTFFEAGQRNQPATNETVVDNATIFKQLSSEPIASLNLTELYFMVDYCIWRNTRYSLSDYWSTLASVYQNQILILHEGDKP